MRSGTYWGLYGAFLKKNREKGLSEQMLCFIPEPGEAPPPPPTVERIASLSAAMQSPPKGRLGKQWSGCHFPKDRLLLPFHRVPFPLSVWVFPYVCNHVYVSVCLAALLYPTVYNIYSEDLALTCGHGSITLYSNSPEVLRRDSQIWRFQMVWDVCICFTCFPEHWPCQRIEVIRLSPLAKSCAKGWACVKH